MTTRDSAPEPALPRTPGAMTLTEKERRTVAPWAADCAERVLPLFEAAAPGDDRPRRAIDALRAFARGERQVGELRRLSAEAHAAARAVTDPAAVAAARAAGHAAATAHMGAHALGAAAYATIAAEQASPDDADVAGRETGWHLDTAATDVRAALAKVPSKGPGGGALGRLHAALLDGMRR